MLVRTVGWVNEARQWPKRDHDHGWPAAGLAPCRYRGGRQGAMDRPADKDRVFGDHAAFFRALLPAIRGIVCHDARARLFWSAAHPDSPAASTEAAYQHQLRQLLRSETPPAAATRLVLDRCVAWLLPLCGADGRPLGVLGLLTDSDAQGLDHHSVVQRVMPALRILQHELSLRRRLLEGQRQLRLQAAEEQLLLGVEALLHGRPSCEQSLQELLRLCHEHLGVAAAWLVLPGKQLALTAGNQVEPARIREAAGGLMSETLAVDGRVGSSPGRLWVPIGSVDRPAQGILALDGWQQSRFSEARLGSILRYVASHVMQLLDRTYDELTGLLAWPLFETELAAAATHGEGVLLVMDIDRLHVFNETFGREVGNEVLQHLAAVLRETLPGQLLTRVTGDQFAALLHHVDLEEARSLGERICVRFRERRFELDGQVHRALLSIGISALDAVADSDGGMGAARVALQAAKDRGRGRVEVYQSADASLVQRTDDLQMLGYVRNAIENNRLVLVAQPLMALRPGRVMHYSEVLVRILDEDGRHVPPEEFMSAAERYQLMEEIDRWVVRTTLELLAEHGSHLGGHAARFAVNLSGQSLGSRQFLHFVESAVRSSGVPPELIAFEITESVAVSKMQQVQAFMQAMRALGCHFSLDDFGTGLSSFAYLKLFPVDTLKIDGSFVRDLVSNVVSQSVVAAVAELARVLQMETVAEFVGDQDSLELLRRLNISWAQGHFVGATGLLADRIEELDRGLRQPEAELLPAAVLVAGGR